MPHKPRIDLPGNPQHVIQRGVDRQPIFFSDDDCEYFLEWLNIYATNRNVLLHAYCFMTNHIHLVLTSPAATELGGLMQDMGRRYVQYVNRTYKRSGGLWQGRYKSSYIQTERYLLVCQRYIELNPVRAEMVKSPADYRWSSYHTNALGEPNGFITPHQEYQKLGDTKEKRLQAYREFFATQADDTDWSLIRAATQQGVVVGESKFIKAIEKRLGHSVQPKPRGRPKKKK